MITEPLFSSFRWKKVIPRLNTLLKHFPYNKVTKPIPNAYKNNSSGIEKALGVVFDFVKDNKDVYLIGEFAYNQFLKESTLKQQNFSEIEIPFYKIVAIDYIPIVKAIIELLKNANYKVDIIEYYPLWSLTDYSVEIMCDQKLVARVFRYQKRCTPIKNITIDKSVVQIGSFDYVLLTELISAFRMKVMNDSIKKDYHNTIVSHLVEMRNYYLKNSKKTLTDDSLFQSLITSCIGLSVNPLEEAFEKRKEKKEMGKPMMFIYKPVRKLEHKWIFANTSGNKVNNPKNLKIRLK
jgi:hypothetical protein